MCPNTARRPKVILSDHTAHVKIKAHHQVGLSSRGEGDHGARNGLVVIEMQSMCVRLDVRVSCPMNQYVPVLYRPFRHDCKGRENLR